MGTVSQILFWFGVFKLMVSARGAVYPVFDWWGGNLGVGWRRTR